jgi:hypothetical protein
MTDKRKAEFNKWWEQMTDGGKWTILERLAALSAWEQADLTPNEIVEAFGRAYYYLLDKCSKYPELEEYVSRAKELAEGGK